MSGLLLAVCMVRVCMGCVVHEVSMSHIGLYMHVDGWLHVYVLCVLCVDAGMAGAVVPGRRCPCGCDGVGT